MNKKTAYNSGIFILLIYLNLTAVFSYAAGYPSYSTESGDDLIADKITDLSSDINFKYTPEVKEYIKRYTKPGRSGSERILGKIPVYFPVFEEKIKARNLPEELKVLAIVESHLNVEAYSKAGAAGLWQLIKGTAKQYNLRVGRSIDERYSVEESTEAALNFLSDLYDQFDDWTLALAAYNCGPGNVRKAIRRSGGEKDFWKIKRFLPKETRNYVPKFVAISYLLKHFRDYGIQPDIPDKRFFETADALVYRHLTFKEISTVTGLPMDIIKKMNYSYRRNFIPANTKGYKLTLPKSALFTLLDRNGYSQMEFDKEHKYDFSKYIIKNFSPEVAMNLLGSKYKWDINMLDINIPLLTKANGDFSKLTEPLVVKSKTRMELDRSKYTFHELKAGETLSDVSVEYNVRIEDLMRWNDIYISSPPQMGASIRIRK